jgi:hypothetical protein
VYEVVHRRQGHHLRGDGSPRRLKSHGSGRERKLALRDVIITTTEKEDPSIVKSSVFSFGMELEDRDNLGVFVGH